MSISVNKVILIGNLTRDPELRHTQNGTPVANLGLATNEVYTDKEGERHDRAEFHTVTAWGRLAEVCQQYMGKGKQIYVEGRLQTRKWDDKEGNKRQATEVIATTLLMLGRKDADQDAGGEFQKPDLPRAPADSKEDLPF